MRCPSPAFGPCGPSCVPLERGPWDGEKTGRGRASAKRATAIHRRPTRPSGAPSSPFSTARVLVRFCHLSPACVGTPLVLRPQRRGGERPGGRDWHPRSRLLGGQHLGECLAGSSQAIDPWVLDEPRRQEVGSWGRTAAEARAPTEAALRAERSAPCFPLAFSPALAPARRHELQDPLAPDEESAAQGGHVTRGRRRPLGFSSGLRSPEPAFRGKAPVPRSGKLTGTQSRFSPQKVLLGDQIRGPVRTTPGTSWQGATRTAPPTPIPQPAARSPQPAARGSAEQAIEALGWQEGKRGRQEKRTAKRLPPRTTMAERGEEGALGPLSSCFDRDVPIFPQRASMALGFGGEDVVYLEDFSLRGFKVRSLRQGSLSASLSFPFASPEASSPPGFLDPLATVLCCKHRQVQRRCERLPEPRERKAEAREPGRAGC